MTNRFIGSNIQRQGGIPVLHRQDFEAHKTGGDFRHTADQIDMNPPVGSLGETTVQGSLELISNIVSSGGSGFISVGSTTGSSGIYNVGSIDTPTFKDALEAAMQDPRVVTYGGTILVLAGVYNVLSTIDVEPGITIVGENAGTIINGQTSNLPLFRVKRTVDSNNINGDSGSGDIAISRGSNLEKIKFENLILVDNLNGSVNSGNCTLTTSAMVQVERGANFECQNVSFWGRLNDGSVVSRQKTRHAIATTSGSANGTTVTVHKCFFDGLCNPINFTPQLGNIDFLNVDNSKFRYYGLETPSPSNTLNTVITSSYCNLNIKNNYAVAGSSDARIFLTITDTGGSTNNINSIISDNIGYIQNISNLPSLIQNSISDPSFILNLKIFNNIWETNNILSNKFEIKISSSPNEDADLVGSYSLNSLIQSNIVANVILQPGGYTVNLTNSVETQLSLFGNKNANGTDERPFVNINVTSGSADNSGNRFITFSKHLKSIRFFRASNVTKVSIYSSWTVGRNSDSIGDPIEVLVEDCQFDGVTLASQNSMINDDDNRVPFKFLVKNCIFNSFAANIGGGGQVCLRLAPSYETKVEGCSFFPLSGYAISYGAALYTYNQSSAKYIHKLSIKDSFIDLYSGNFWFSEPNPFVLADGSVRSHLIDIDDGVYGSDQSTDLLIDNLTVRVDADDPQEDSNSFYTGLDVRRFININVDNCTITNSKFEIPFHTYNNSGTKAIAGIYLTWKKNININNCIFWGGSNAIKVVLPTGSTYYPNNLFINNNIFEPTLSGSLATRTMLDIDVAYQASPNNNPKINITNNNLFIKKDDELHEVEVQYTYKSRGVVQINAPGCDVAFNDNQIRTTLREISGVTNENLTGVYINTSKNNASLINRFTLLNVNNNSVNLENIFNVGGAVPDSSSNIFAALWCEGTIVKITNNILNYEPRVSGGTGTRTVLCLECSDVSGTGDYLISQNIFSRAARGNIFGGAYLRSYLYLTNTDVYGRIIDNSFVNEDPSGEESYDDLLVIGPSVTIEPIFERNKNQRGTVVYSGYGFQASLNNSIINNNPLSSHQLNTTIWSGLSDSSDPVWEFEYNGAESMIYRLFAPIEQLIPVGARFISATSDVSVTSVFTAPSSANLKVYNLTDDFSIASASVNLASVTSGSLSVSASPTQYIISGKHKAFLILTVGADLSVSGLRTVTIPHISITYRY